MQKYHGQQGLTVHEAKLDAITVHVPASRISEHAPVVVDIDFDLLRRTMEKDRAVGPKGRVYFSASILVPDAGRLLTWELPFENVPQGMVRLREGDPVYDPFLSIETVLDKVRSRPTRPCRGRAEQAVSCFAGMVSARP